MSDDPLDPSPFAEQIIATKGNESRNEIYTSVGRANDQWEHCDMVFATVYAALVVPGRSNHVLMRAFGTITAPVTKKGMIWEACDAFFGAYPSERLHSQSRRLLNLYVAAAAKRNEIVHAVVDVDTCENNSALWFLVPPLFSTRKQKLFHEGPKYRYSSAEIDKLALNFWHLTQSARRLSDAIRDHGIASQGIRE